MDNVIFKREIIAHKIGTACSKTSYKIFPSKKLNKYLRSDNSEREVNVNTSVNNVSKKL